MKSSMTNTIVHADNASPDQMLQDVIRTAQQIARRERIERIAQWEARGHIRVDHRQSNIISVRLEDMTFDEHRIVFPTVDLIAKLALGIESGLSCRDHDVRDYHTEDAMQYGVLMSKRPMRKVSDYGL